MIDPKSMKKWVLSSTLAGVMLTAPMIGHAALGDQTLKRGMSHDDVKQLQDVLKNKGHFTYHTSTGYFGTITQEAVKQFQRERNLAVDGVVGSQTFQALGVTTSTISSKNEEKEAQSPIRPNGLLRNGSRGQAVVDVQNRLKAAGLYAYSVDGIYGPITVKAVKQFQQRHGLQVDGIVGAETVAALNRVDKSSTSSSPKPTPEKDKSEDNQIDQLLRLGSRGDAVSDVQKKLQEAGVFAGIVDGIFGQQTLSAVRQFQLQQGLAVDGIVGPATFAQLRSPQKSKPEEKDADQASFNVMQLIADAGALKGTPYAWGGTTPSGFDCSGFLMHVFNKQGIDLPRTVAEQWQAGKTISQPSVGDVVFFETYTSGPSHNGIYVGNNQFIHSGTSTGVTVSDLGSSYWKSRYLGAKQLY